MTVSARRLALGVVVLFVAALLGLWLRANRGGSLVGTLSVPTSWGAQRKRLTISYLDRDDKHGSRPDQFVEDRDLRPRSGNPNLFDWRVAGLQPGRYLVFAFPFLCAKRVTVEDDGPTPLSLEVQDPADTFVHVRFEGDNRGDLSQCVVKWHFRLESQGWPIRGTQSATWDETSGAFRFLAPPIEVQVEVKLEHFAANNDLSPILVVGRNDVDVVLHRAD